MFSLSKCVKNYGEVQLLAVSVCKASNIMSKWESANLEDIQCLAVFKPYPTKGI